MHPEHRSIGELAYRLWQARGCPDGTAEQDWLEAEKQLEASRPARPPASHLPDVPPANAAAKWKAAEAAREKPARRAEPSRVEASRAEPTGKSPPRRRSQAESGQSLPGDSKPTRQSKPRNDTAS
jgi:hypothetical protein